MNGDYGSSITQENFSATFGTFSVKNAELTQGYTDLSSSNSSWLYGETDRVYSPASVTSGYVTMNLSDGTIVNGVF